jgi:hypothetical protein
MGDFFQISTSSVSQFLNYTTTLFSNVLPIILPLLALIIGFWIFEVIIHKITPRAKEAGWYHEFKDDKPTWRGRYYEKGEEFDEPEDEDL